MTEKLQHGSARRERTRARASLNGARDALSESHWHARKGDLNAAERAARLAEHHVKLAERLLNAKISLQRVVEARRNAERAFEQTCAAREAGLKEREKKLRFAELMHRPRERHTPPLDPHADRWKERLARISGETSD